jgi:hypothetical protein
MLHYAPSGNASAAIGFIPLQSRRVLVMPILEARTASRMNFIQHDLGGVVVEADILRDTVECDRCGVPGELLAGFFYCPHGVDAPLGDEELLPVVLIMCPVCGRRFQFSDLDCRFGD